MPVERALVSVYDKSGLAEFVRQLAACGIEIVSTGGTAKLLREAGITVRDVAELTGWPEMLGGRVKTLHPKVHGGILFRRGEAGDLQQTAEHKIAPIDLVVVNLYPFEATAARPDLTPEELIENIDIGGPTMVRSAAKNFESVAVVTDPRDYAGVAGEIKAHGAVSLETRLELARKAFALTARYDGRIATELERLSASNGTIQLGERPLLPERLHFAYTRRQELRYGENPHQRAALYVPAGADSSGLASARQLQGKELSYNNLVDLESALSLVLEFRRPAAVILKHSNPCGTAEQDTLVEAYVKALACDPISAFGSVMAFNRTVDAATAGEVVKLFAECIVAPGYEPEALEKLSSKKNLRVLQLPAKESSSRDVECELKRVSGGVLVQEQDRHELAESELKVVTRRAPTREELDAMLFGWKVCKHVKSNAIVFARPGQTVGVGAGQMSRVDAVKIAVMKSQLPLAGSVVASDAFFPFPDGVEEAGKAGATAVIQPGGSVRDAEVIAAADRLGIAMVFCGVRHFWH
ncbi:MAG TPA: bifunctional phosphoribosylaminoimidazolecarboxamide formyltransferase/IMP cyclohydrolase [Candidatus Dormibacteraeota bacterium]|nr:bifunctional phosphoribosylaminoimidazolecarboxamide formyltransferase/IMP cyclohydrolase [Candidatus Dormibacteraeota bacterium]